MVTVFANKKTAKICEPVVDGEIDEERFVLRALNVDRSFELGYV